MLATGYSLPATSAQPTLALIDELLAEQQTLQTPVARYSRIHDTRPALSQVYRDLIPLSAPGPGEQYAFEVDIDSCSGCKACVSGCHSLNGLDEHETWRDVGLVTGGDSAHPFQQTITSACPHCADPACMNGCPVLAYEKDPLTGIVRHLDDQCIGCSYCILKCPYDVPKFSQRLGIVRKCDMCHGRLGEGEAPACVQACPTNAIRIVTVPVADRRADTSAFLSAAPDPAYTQPTTRYVSQRDLPSDLRAADHDAPRVQHAHWALIFLLVLTQAGYGLLLGGQHIWAGRILVLLGLAASGAHLGRPLRAWRIFLGWRLSWLSREAMIFGASAGALAASYALTLSFFPPLGLPENLPAMLQDAGVALGLGGVFCSIMIYVDTRRRAWAFPASALRMGGTVAVAALAFVLPHAAAGALLAKLAGELVTVRSSSLTGRLQRGPLRAVTLLRFALGLAAVATFALGAPLIGAVLFLAGEFAERYLYFTSVDSPKMPGVSAL